MKIAMGPEADQIKELMEGPKDTPVVMVNLLRFNKTADVPGEEISGMESYMRYAEPMRKLVESHGGRFIWSGSVDSHVVGRSDVDFEVVALVEYPSREVFAKITTTPEFQEISVHRTNGLEGQWLIAATEGI